MASKNGRMPLSIEGIKLALIQGESADARQRYLASLQKRIAGYERKYNLHSTCLAKAIDAGRVAENLDVVKWLNDYEALNCLEHRGKTRLLEYL